MIDLTLKFWVPCVNRKLGPCVYLYSHFRTPSINAQCQSMPIKIVALIPMLINTDLKAFRIKVMIFIDIDRHLELIEGVLSLPFYILHFCENCQNFSQILIDEYTGALNQTFMMSFSAWPSCGYLVSKQIITCIIIMI